MVRQPYTYSMPESFLKDTSVPARWRVLAVINGFILNGGCFYGSNEWLMGELSCSQHTISTAFTELEELQEIRTERTRRTRKVYKTSRDSNQLLSEIATEHAGDSNQLLPNSVSNSVIDTSADEPREIIEVFEESERAPKKPPKYPNARTVFSWFPDTEPSWKLNTTELKHAELLYLRGESKVRSALAYVKEHQDDDFFYSITSPSELERKWVKLVNHK